jgi:hypothetical protein
MGNFLIVIGFLVICSAPLSVYASEIFGRISTVPIVNTQTGSSVPEAVKPVEMAVPGGAAISGPTPTLFDLATNTGTDQPAVNEETAKKVLGQKLYPENSLVRNEEGRIFLIQNQIKKPIRNKLELEKYRGQAMLKGTAENLSLYQTGEYLDGNLIRQINDVKVYALKSGPKHHILNLAELAKYYFGLPIYNLEPEEMKKYD